MKIVVFLSFLWFSYIYSQGSFSDTINIDRLSNQEVKEMINRCWPKVKDTIYYSDYFDGIKLMYSRYASFLDSNNIVYGPVSIYDIFVKEKKTSFGFKEETNYTVKEIYQLVPPYELILIESSEEKNGFTIKRKLEKKDNIYISYFDNGKFIETDTIFDFKYSLNDDWAKFWFNFDTTAPVNSVLETKKNLNYTTFEFEPNYTTLISREDKLINGVRKKFITTQYTDEFGVNTAISDEFLTIVEERIGDDYLHVIEDKEKALNFESQPDFGLFSYIGVDVRFCAQLKAPDDNKDISNVIFEIIGNQNPFDTTSQQLFFSENGKNYMEIRPQPDYISEVSEFEISDNLKETDFYPIKDPDVIQMAKNATKGIHSKRKKIQLLMNFVNKYIIYSKDDYSQWHISVYNIINTRNGVCQDYAELFTTLARSIGIACKTVGGYALDPINGLLCGHAWNEVEINGKWYGVDPTWNMWLPTLYHYKENSLPINLNASIYFLRLKSITNTNGAVLKFD
jgi:hypothetical protein